MTTALDSRLVPKVLRIVNKYGATATLTQHESTGYNPDVATQPAATEDDPAPESIKCVPPEITRTLGDELASVNTRLRSYIAASGLTQTPTAGKTLLTIGSNVYRITEVNPVYTGDQIALWELFLASQ